MAGHILIPGVVFRVLRIGHRRPLGPEARGQRMGWVLLFIPIGRDKRGQGHQKDQDHKADRGQFILKQFLKGRTDWIAVLVTLIHRAPLLIHN